MKYLSCFEKVERWPNRVVDCQEQHRKECIRVHLCTSASRRCMSVHCISCRERLDL
ncbi:hypothetical protein BC827DRAFT_1244874, partial [Russula dissimulans]